MADLPTPPELTKFPKCYAKDCDRLADGDCPRLTCPIPGAPPVVASSVEELRAALNPGRVIDPEGKRGPTPSRAAELAEMSATKGRIGIPASEVAAASRPLGESIDSPLSRLRSAEILSPPANPMDPPFPIDPRDKDANCVLQAWVTDLPLRHQGVLVCAVRGCDTAPKNDSSKLLSRAYRATVLNPFCRDATKSATFLTPATGRVLDGIFAAYRNNLDHYPHHVVMHQIHAVEIVGYHHFDFATRGKWQLFYLNLCRGLHVRPETKDELYTRLTADEVAFGAEDRR